MSSFNTSIAGIKLDHPIMNAAGPECKKLEDVESLARSSVAAVMVGSITLEERPGNPGNVYWQSPTGFSLNSLGLPCPNVEYYKHNLPILRDGEKNVAFILCYIFFQQRLEK